MSGAGVRLFRPSAGGESPAEARPDSLPPLSGSLVLKAGTAEDPDARVFTLRADPAAAKVSEAGTGSGSGIGYGALDGLEQPAFAPDQGMTTPGTLGSDLGTAMVVTDH